MQFGQLGWEKIAGMFHARLESNVMLRISPVGIHSFQLEACDSFKWSKIHQIHHRLQGCKEIEMTPDQAINQLKDYASYLFTMDRRNYVVFTTDSRFVLNDITWEYAKLAAEAKEIKHIKSIYFGKTSQDGEVLCGEQIWTKIQESNLPIYTEKVVARSNYPEKADMKKANEAVYLELDRFIKLDFEPHQAQQVIEKEIKKVLVEQGIIFSY